MLCVLALLVLLVPGCGEKTEIGPTQNHDIFEIFDEVEETEQYFLVRGKGVFNDSESGHIASDIIWQEQLAHFLISNYPSLISEETKKQNEELQKFLFGDNGKIFTLSQNDIPSDVVISIPKDEDSYYSLTYSLPWRLEFRDLDNDGIPELFITNAVMNGEISFSTDIYKFNGNSFARIGNSRGPLYIDDESRIVSIGPGIVQYKIDDEIVPTGSGIELFELADDTIVFSEFADAAGNTAYNGVAFREIGWRNARDFMDYSDFDALIDHLNLRLFPKFDDFDISDLFNI